MSDPKRKAVLVRKPVDDDDEKEIKKRMAVLNRKSKSDPMAFVDTSNEWMDLNDKLKRKK